MINNDLSDAVIEHGAWALEGIGLIDSGAAMEQDLNKTKAFRGDVLNAVSYLTPYMPWPGLLFGVLVVGKHIYAKLTGASTSKPQQTKSLEEEQLD